MKPTCYLLLALFLAAAGCKKAAADLTEKNPADSNPQWVVYNKANSSLPDNQVTAIAIDKNDVKWIGTANGLCRLSGSAWTTFTETNAGLPSSFIRAVAVEEDGTVWAGTDKGLARYNGTQWISYTSGNSSMTANGILCITHDAARKFTWVATGKELIRIDANNRWERFDAVEDDLVLSMAVDRDGALWLGTFYHFSFRGRIRKFFNNQWTTFQLDQMGYPSTFPYSVAIDRHNTVFAVLTGTSVKSIIRFQNGAWQEVPGPAAATGLKRILLDEDNVWVGGNALTLFGNVQTLPLSLPGGSSGIQAMALDSKRKKWLGTIDSGVAVY